MRAHQERIDQKLPKPGDPGWRQGHLVSVSASKPTVIADRDGVVAVWVFPAFLSQNSLLCTIPARCDPKLIVNLTRSSRSTSMSLPLHMPSANSPRQTAVNAQSKAQNRTGNCVGVSTRIPQLMAFGGPRHIALPGTNRFTK